jgi:acyl-CoA synthetase (NDP forming)
VLPVIAADPSADLVFIHIPVAGAGYDVDAFARDTAAFAKSSGKPVAVAAWQEVVAAPFRQAGVATYANEHEALSTFAQIASHWELLRRPLPRWEPTAPAALPEGTGLLNEAQSLALLAGQGIPVVPHRLCRTADEARAAFDALGGPVAVKACSRDVPHKSEHGLVALNLQSADAVAACFDQQWAQLAAMGAAQEGVLVARMRKSRHECMVGAHIDPVFGPVVAVGDGGKYVEAMRDVALLVPPFDRGEVLQALQGLRIAPILAGTRGDPPLDVQALADIAVRVGQLVVASTGRIASVDLNPVMLGAAGEGAVVVDALIESNGAGPGRSPSSP